MFSKSDLSIYKMTSKDSARPVLTAVQFKSTESGARLAATDGYKLTEKLISFNEPLDFEELLISYKTIEKVSKLMGKTDRVLITKASFTIVSNIGDVKTRLDLDGIIEGNYPEYEKLIPSTEASNKIILNPKFLIEALGQVDADNAHSIVLEIRDGNLTPVVITSKGENVTIQTIVMPLKA